MKTKNTSTAHHLLFCPPLILLVYKGYIIYSITNYLPLKGGNRNYLHIRKLSFSY
jgi:hypothetical protein